MPTAATVRLPRPDLADADERELTRYRRDHVGFVFQFYNLIPSLTARENVALVTDIADDPMAPEEALALVGLGDRLDHFPAQLSGGEQQRVAIARAIAKRPDLLLCDEPTGALDFETGILVLDALDAVNRELGTTTAVITHNAAHRAIADRVSRFLGRPHRRDYRERDAACSPTRVRLVNGGCVRSTKKLFRDLWQPLGAVARDRAGHGLRRRDYVIMAVGTYRSLDETRAAYYERYRFGDVFASATRAPQTLAASIAAIDGVAAVEARIALLGTVDIPLVREPINAHDHFARWAGEPAVNALFLREGRLPAAGRGNEAVVSETFARAHGFDLGSRFDTVSMGPGPG